MLLAPITVLSDARPLMAAVGRRRFGLVAAGVSLLAGFALTAVAVAPLATGASDPPRRVVTEVVAPPGLDAQIEALAVQDMQLTRSDITRATDSADTLMGRLGVRDPAAARFLRTDASARAVLSGRGGKMAQARTRADGSLLELVVRYPSDKPELASTHFNRLTFARTAADGGGDWSVRMHSVPYTAQVRLASGTIRNTLFGATDESGVPDSVAAQLADVFSADIDFHRELRRGDTFSVVYESLAADGEPVAWNEGAGRMLAAEFVNHGRTVHAVWFAAADGRGAYYGLDGSSRRRAFLASPMAFSRVTSGFAMRLHPLARQWRKHLGVDYGAPVGTPVRSVADGVVEFAGRQNGYGNVLQIAHGNQRNTLYAHLSRMDVRKGQRVEQGQRIGAVGMTGWTTGPHLHYEFRVGGQHRDPLRMARTAEAQPVDAASRERFQRTVRVFQDRLELAGTLASGARP